MPGSNPGLPTKMETKIKEGGLSPAAQKVKEGSIKEFITLLEGDGFKKEETSAGLLLTRSGERWEFARLSNKKEVERKALHFFQKWPEHSLAVLLEDSAFEDGALLYSKEGGIISLPEGVKYGWSVARPSILGLSSEGETKQWFLIPKSLL